MPLQLSDWYNISRHELDKLGGRGLWRYFISLEDLLKSNYPEYPWDIARFIGAGRKNVPIGFWRDKNNIIRALEKAEEVIGIKKVLAYPKKHFAHFSLWLAAARRLVLSAADGIEGSGLSIWSEQAAISRAVKPEISLIQVGQGVPAARQVCAAEETRKSRHRPLPGKHSHFHKHIKIDE